VIFVSASATDIEAQLQALGRPASAYIDKPFGHRAVVAAVKHVLHQR
jgi:DNA-binding response OmpR family regulator